MSSTLKKSHVLIFGVDNSPSTDIYLGDQRLKVTKSDKHLGVPLASDAGLLSDSINGYISKGRRAFMRLLVWVIGINRSHLCR